jgi:hypothetical protein
MNFGDFGNLKEIFSQVRDAQKHVKELQKELKNMRVEVQTGAGVVTAIVDGESLLVDLKIDTTILDPDELKALPQLIVKAVQEAQKKAKAEATAKAKLLTGGMNLPGMGL